MHALDACGVGGKLAFAPAEFVVPSCWQHWVQLHVLCTLHNRRHPTCCCTHTAVVPRKMLSSYSHALQVPLLAAHDSARRAVPLAQIPSTRQTLTTASCAMPRFELLTILWWIGAHVTWHGMPRHAHLQTCHAVNNCSIPTADVCIPPNLLSHAVCVLVHSQRIMLRSHCQPCREAHTCA